MMLIFQVLNSLAWSMAMGPVFDRYLYYLGGGAAVGPTFAPRHARNSLVGMTESVSGIANLILAAPIGLLVDAYPRKRVRLLKCAAALAVASSLLTIVACVTDLVLLLYAALVLVGTFSGLSSSASEALFADSIPQGRRTKLFTTKSILTTVGSACGPMLSAFGLVVMGDRWRPHQMKAVVVTGALLMPASCVPLLFFRDPPAAEEEEQEGGSGAGASQCERPQLRPCGPTAAEVGAGVGQPGGVGTASPAPALHRLGPLGPRHVPLILALSDFTTCIGAGMTVKFFNLFFIQDMGFSPIGICLLQTAYPLVIAVFMKYAERLSKPLGRAQASNLFFACNVACLLLMSTVRSLPVLLVVFLVRGGFANSSYPIDRSILMDFTPSSQRGRWNALESLSAMTWSGSAFLGGLLADSHDYRFTFLITALVYALACLLYSPLLALVPRKEGAMSAGGGLSWEAPFVSTASAAPATPERGAP